MSNRYTTLPCGLKLRLDVEMEDLDMIGDTGFCPAEGNVRPVEGRTRFSISASPKNLMALSAFFLARAQEATELDSD